MSGRRVSFGPDKPSNFFIRAQPFFSWGSEELALNPCVVCLGPVFPAPTPYEVSRTEVLAERQRAHSADHAGLEVEKHRVWYVLAARGCVVKHTDAAELRAVVAAVLAVAANAMLVAQHLLNTGFNLATTLARLHVQNFARGSSLEAGGT